MPRYTAKQFIEAIPGTYGIITNVAENVGCSWPTAKKYIESYPTVKAAFEAERQRMIDTAETVLVQALNEGDIGSAKWMLSRLARDRGYGERQDIDITSEGEKIKLVSVSGIDVEKDI